MSERVDELIAAMTLDEKAGLTGGVDMWHAIGAERVGIAGLKVSDGPNGARGNSWTDTTSACTPCGTALGSTWNPELVGRVGGVLGAETRSKQADVLLAPTVNLHRSPLAGRNFECYSEDPLLTAQLAVAYIDGVQGEGVGCAVKHFVANDSEFERHTISSEVGDRALRELYLVPFEAAIVRARSMSIMSAYNRLRGVYCAEHPLLFSLLEEWGFDGFIISDWWGTKSTAGTAAHGVDLEMPGPPVFLGDKLADAIRAGEANEADLDAKLRRLLGVMERLGVLDRDPASPRAAEESLDLPEHREVLREAARESVVLLRNEPVAGSPTLPVLPGTVRRIAVVGPNADVHLVQGGGSAAVNPHYSVTVLDGLRARYGDDVEIVFARGCDAYRNLPPLDHRWVRNGDRSGFELEYHAGRELAGDPVVVAHTDVPRLTWLGDPAEGVTGGDFSLRVRGTFTAPVTGPFELSMITGGKGRVLVDGEVVLDMWDDWVPGDAFFGLGSAEIRARIDVTEGQELSIVGEFASIEGLAAAAYLLGGLPVLADDSIEQAAAVAADADVAIVVVGLNQDWETEGADRADWHLPGRQVDLIEAVAAAQPRTAVLIQAGSPVAMDWEDRVGAVAQLWYLGQETGNAVADLVSGDHSPSGRLPTTFPRSFEDHPAFENYPGEFGEVLYGEGVFAGYRFYDHREIEPRYPFGHGLGYSSFTVDDLAVTDGEGPVTASVRVTNTGAVTASHVVQVYVAPLSSPVARPPQELKGFAKVTLEPGASTRVDVELDDRAFQHWDPVAGAWALSGADFEVRAGSSSRDITTTAAVTRGN
ncbi:MAG: glycoside hydrolase family 3 C-terminal domain-containing protein [Acidimicrobiales bacterium]